MCEDVDGHCGWLGCSDSPSQGLSRDLGRTERTKGTKGTSGTSDFLLYIGCFFAACTAYCGRGLRRTGDWLNLTTFPLSQHSNPRLGSCGEAAKTQRGKKLIATWGCKGLRPPVEQCSRKWGIVRDWGAKRLASGLPRQTVPNPRAGAGSRSCAQLPSSLGIV